MSLAMKVSKESCNTRHAEFIEGVGYDFFVTYYSRCIASSLYIPSSASPSENNGDKR